MVSEKSELLYAKVAKVSGIAIPILYIFLGLLCIAMFALTGVVLFGTGELEMDYGSHVDLTNLDWVNRIVLALAFVFTLGCLVRLFRKLIQVARYFKEGSIFSEQTADCAHSAAFTLLIIYIGSLFIGAHVAFLSGDLRLDIPDGVFAIVFAYLFAWVLKIGSQLKAENDLTV